MRIYRMEKDASFSFLLSSLALLIPFPGRLAYGLVFVLLLNVQMLSIVFFRFLVKLVHLDDMLSVLTAAMLICESIIFKQILSLYSPIMALTLSFVIYLPAVSSFVISQLNSSGDSQAPLEQALHNMRLSLFFSILSLLFFLIRDLFGYGTISFPGRKALHCLYLLPQTEGAHIGCFLATIPGAILLVFFSAFLVWKLHRKFDSVGGRADDNIA
ncbi:MAG: hypothetical protein IJU95_10355 [Treponema sp.]|nr:hypothetical protein [Treponema sp.]